MESLLILLGCAFLAGLTVGVLLADFGFFLCQIKESPEKKFGNVVEIRKHRKLEQFKDY